MFLLFGICHLLSWLPVLVVVLGIWQLSKQAPLKIQPYYDQSTLELVLAGTYL
ncbi:hypothetical protein [Pantoea sp. BAV 3049]|uniref:hypothetical protein n=1 Tax=Pantoea sp. BAV 3049 TaxID=2654188 RepID=UPI00131B098D|nr:hypothetical protein [Pantoea sp. BAV 3049]